MSRRNWNRVRPNSLRNALELCKDHAREVRNLSVEQIADRMGLADHWALYKWLQNGRMPIALVRPYEIACGVCFVTQWQATSAERLLIEIPHGRTATAADMQALQEVLNTATGRLIQFYAGRADAGETLAAIGQAMESLGFHRANVAMHAAPELNFTGEQE